jgi:hypothetical protein
MTKIRIALGGTRPAVTARVVGLARSLAGQVTSGHAT